jgi:hypothetical protein
MKTLRVVGPNKLWDEVVAFFPERGVAVERLRSARDALLTPPTTPEACLLLDWANTDGLLTDEHRPELLSLTAAQQVVLLVPNAWVRSLQQSGLPLLLLARPFIPEELWAVMVSERELQEH